MYMAVALQAWVEWIINHFEYQFSVDNLLMGLKNIEPHQFLVGFFVCHTVKY